LKALENNDLFLKDINLADCMLNESIMFLAGQALVLNRNLIKISLDGTNLKEAKFK